MINRFIDKIIRFILKGKSLPLIVSCFLGFSFGLLFSAIFFPEKLEFQIIEKTIQNDVLKNNTNIKDKKEVFYNRVEYESLIGWNDDKLSEVLPLIKAACTKIVNRVKRKSTQNNFLSYSDEWKSACYNMINLNSNSDDLVKEELVKNFIPYSVVNGKNSKGIFTGYYEVILDGSMKKSANYDVPLYSLPNDIIKIDNRAFKLPRSAPKIIGQVVQNELIPYDNRKKIEENSNFSERAKILVWVKSSIDAHLLHIQGSGIIKFKDGSYRRIGYAGNNGRKFKGIGSILINAGVIKSNQGSMPEIVKWLKNNPKKASTFMAENPRFIFFRWIKGAGPIGAFGIPLVAKRSLAIDPKFIPYGAPIWLETSGPDNENINRLVVALDTGAAIKGAIRGDFFWGKGESAFAKAGRMKSKGKYYILLPNGIIPN